MALITNIDQVKAKEPEISSDRETAYRALINRWLKEDPRNLLICKAVIEQNKRRRELLTDTFGGLKTAPKDMRIGLSLPPQLYYILENYEKLNGKKFLSKECGGLVWFNKKFPQFTIAERI